MLKSVDAILQKAQVVVDAEAIGFDADKRYFCDLTIQNGTTHGVNVNLLLVQFFATSAVAQTPPDCGTASLEALEFVFSHSAPTDTGLHATAYLMNYVTLYGDDVAADPYAWEVFEVASFATTPGSYIQQSPTSLSAAARTMLEDYAFTVGNGLPAVDSAGVPSQSYAAAAPAIEQQLQIIDAGIAALPSWDREIVQCVADIAVKQLEAAVAYEAWSSSPIDYVAMNERLGGAVEAAAAGAGQAGGNGSETHSGASNTQAAIKTTPVLVAILKRHPSNYYRELWNANEAGFVSFWTSGARQLGLLPGTTAPSKQGPYDHQSFNEDDALP